MQKTLMLTFLLVLASVDVFSQQRWSVTYTNPYCTNGAVEGFGVEVLNDTIYTCGVILNEDCQNRGFLAKYDLEGNVIATRMIQDSTWSGFSYSLDVGMNMIEWSGINDFILQYNQFNNTFDSSRTFIRKFDANLQDIWVLELPRPDTSDVALLDVVRRDSQGNILVAGDGRDSYSMPQTDSVYSYLTKLDSIGNILWQRKYDYFVGVHHITELDNGDIILNGYDFNSINNIDNIKIKKVDSLGTPGWQYTTGGLFETSSTTIGLTNGELIVISTWNEDDPPSEFWDRPFVEYRKIDSQGTNFPQLDNVKLGRFGGSVNVYSSKKLGDGSIVICGQHSDSMGDSVPIFRGFILKVNSNLDSVWFRRYWHPEESTIWGDCRINDIDTTLSGGFICAGSVVRYSQQNQTELWLMRLDEFGCLEPGCQNVNISEVVIGFENTMKVFPNPVQDHATIQFDIPNLATLQNNFNQTQLIVTDINGHEIERKNLPSIGSFYQLELNTTQYASGLYQVHWVSGNSWLDTVELVKM